MTICPSGRRQGGLAFSLGRSFCFEARNGNGWDEESQLTVFCSYLSSPLEFLSLGRLVVCKNMLVWELAICFHSTSLVRCLKKSQGARWFGSLCPVKIHSIFSSKETWPEVTICKYQWKRLAFFRKPCLVVCAQFLPFFWFWKMVKPRTLSGSLLGGGRNLWEAGVDASWLTLQYIYI